MRLIAAQLEAMQQEKAATQKQYRDWRSIARAPASAPRQNGGSDVVATALVGVLLDGLFGMGLFSGLGEAAQGLAHMTAMEHSTRRTAPKQPAALQPHRRLNNQMNDRKDFTAALSAQKSQTQQMKHLQQMLAMLLMNMLSHQTGEDEGSSEGGHEIAADPLRQQTMGFFIKNRKDMICISKMFGREMKGMVTPKFETLRYA